MRAAVLAVLLAANAPVGATRFGVDALLSTPLHSPFISALGPGFGASLAWPLNETWTAGLGYGQRTFFEDGYYVSARAVDLRLRHRLGPAAWLEAGAGVNPMAWHFSNWPSWGHAVLEAGRTHKTARGPDWEWGLGCELYGPAGDPLLLLQLRAGPRW